MHWPSDEWLRFVIYLLVLGGIYRALEECSTHLKAIAEALEKLRPKSK